MFSHVEVHNLPAVMVEYDEHIEDTEFSGWESEKIHRYQTVCMIVKKSPPSL